LWDNTEHECVIAGPSETGKTYAALHKLHNLMLTHKGSQAAIVRKTYQSMHGSVLQTYRRILGKDTNVHSFGGEKPEWFDYPNGSRVFVGGMDNPQKVLSSERDFIFVNQAEELDLGDWETLTTRCTGRGGVAPFAQIFGDCNPGPSTHWILNRPSLRVLYSHHEDNPTLFDDSGQITEQGERTMQVLDALTGVRYKRLRLGLWVGAEGMVYEEWNREDHVKSEEQLREWGIIV
jgi:phage terminase large subunit